MSLLKEAYQAIRGKRIDPYTVPYIQIKRGLKIQHHPGLVIAGVSIANRLHPNRNEDSFFISDRVPAFGVLDGVGQSKHPQEASQAAARFCQDYLEGLPKNLSPEEMGNQMAKMLREAHEAVKTNPRAHGGSTTASIVYMLPANEARIAVIANVGDSRVYHYQKDKGELVRITTDDNRINRDPTYQPDPHQPNEGARLTQSLGALVDKEGKVVVVNPRIHLVALKRGDTVLALSDGAYGNCLQLRNTIASSRDPEYMGPNVVHDALNYANRYLIRRDMSKRNWIMRKIDRRPPVTIHPNRPATPDDMTVIAAKTQ